VTSERLVDETTAPPPPPGRRTRRLRWLVPAALVLVWLVVGGFGGQYQGKLAEVQRNDLASFLPENAESTKVVELQESFQAQQTFPAFLLLESGQALTPQQVAAFTQFANAAPGLEVPVKGKPSVKVGDFLVPGPVTVLPAQDGKAVLAILAFDADKAFGTLDDGTNPVQKSVELLREKDTALAGNGSNVYVAGPAGGIADQVKAFEGIDGTLLGVSLLAVLIILLVVYRSPVLPIYVLTTSLLALGLASVAVYFLADNDVIRLNGQSQGILFVLVIGAATDYALLLVSRYREELRRHDDRFEAMSLAWRRTLEPVAASAGTVILGLLCLLLSDLQSTKGLGPVGAIGIAAAFLAAMTFLPALLVVFGRTSAGEHGRWVFWPGIPHYGSKGPETRGIWARVARLVGDHPRRVAIGSGVALLALAAFLPTLKASGISNSDIFLTEVESVTGGEALSRHFPGGSGTPTIVIGPADKAQALADVVRQDRGVQSVVPLTDGPPQPGAQPKVADGRVQLQATLKDTADSPAAEDTVVRLRSSLDAVSTDAVVGGGTATGLDIREIGTADRNRVIPVILLVILVVLALLLRSLAAPAILIVGNVLSFAATLGAAAIMFNYVFDFAGSDPTVTLFGFVFLVALGIDYSIFLMTRVREESARQGTRPGILHGLAVTGGVITSAGIVLAATFAALGVLPILFLRQIAFIVAFGVLLDTLVVRSLFVPSVAYLLGRHTWAPSKLARADQPEEPGEPDPSAPQPSLRT
jgi:RND superfamily putative drug exporter